MGKEMTKAWESNLRVKAMKIAIQCVKLLQHTQVIRFYPAKFVIVTDILDNCGKLLFDRIQEKASYINPGTNQLITLPDDFTAEMVPAHAKELAKNYFFKMASIRELITRLNLQTAILKCYSFLTSDSGEYETELVKLTRMTRGIGDPLVATFARSYICRVGISAAADVNTHLMSLFADSLATCTQFGTEPVKAQIKAEAIVFAQYINLYVPALFWILQCIAYKVPGATLGSVLDLMEVHARAKCPLEFITARAVWLRIIRGFVSAVEKKTYLLHGEEQSPVARPTAGAQSAAPITAELGQLGCRVRAAIERSAPDEDADGNVDDDDFFDDDGDDEAAPKKKATKKKAESAIENPLPDGWSSKPDPVTGKLYYFHAGLKRSQWARPESAHSANRHQPRPL